MENDTIPQPVSAPQEVQAVPLQTPFQGFSLQRINKKILIIVGFILGLILLLLIGIVVFSKKNVSTPSTTSVSVEKTWEIIFTYNPKDDSFSLKKLTLLNRKITPDYRGGKFSEYKLNVLDDKKQVLYSSKVAISTDVIFDMLAYPTGTVSAIPVQPITNILYAPYFENEKNITLTKNDKVVLNLVLPTAGKSSFKFNPIQQAYAETCSPLTVVFLSDGYSDFNQYHKDVQTFEQTFQTTQPYASKNPTIFDFKVVDNTQRIGCSANGLLSCMTYNQALIDQIARSQYPSFSKAVVIANAPFSNPIDQGVVGISSGIGGNYAAFPNNFGNISALTLVVARHELLGHAVGFLYDRYVAKNSLYGKLDGTNRSNCTDNPSGEAFWKGVGKPQTSLGCGNPALYAPAPAPSCQRTTNPNLTSAGTPESIMSAAGCGGSNFDSVETQWINTNVLPDYTGCANGSGVTPPVGATATPTPTTTPASQESNKIIVTVFTDANNNLKQDNGESGIQGASITLSGALNQSVNTDASGGVTFQNAPAGDYTLVAKVSGQIVGQGPFSIANDTITTEKITIPVSPQFAVNPTPIIINPTIITPTPTNTPAPTPTSFPGGFEPNGTPVPTPDTLYNCYLDPACVRSGKSIQQCKLICNPQ